jgi:hypothetical protein
VESQRNEVIGKFSFLDTWFGFLWKQGDIRIFIR